MSGRVGQRWLHSEYTRKWELTISGGGGAWDKWTYGLAYSYEVAIQTRAKLFVCITTPLRLSILLTNTPSIQMHVLIRRPWAFLLVVTLLGDFRKPRSISPSDVLCRIVGKKNDQEGVVVFKTERG